MGILYIVATPIGNLEDVTHRALRVLGEVDVVFCEDTRVTKRLLEKYAITTPTDSFHAQSSNTKTEKILALLQKGKDIALVSDAGTPTISDPGSLLIHKARELGATIIPIPGASAVTAALSASGLPASAFVFLGFLPHKKGRATLFKEIAESKRTVVFYESPHRISKTLETLAQMLDENRTIVVARELTKIHEELVDGSAQAVLEYYRKHEEKIRGEFVVIVAPH